MYKDKKIGVGVITYNREESFNKVITAIKDIDYIDTITIVKHQDKPYKNYHPNNFVNDKIKYINVVNNLGVASVKNAAFKDLLNKNCDHIFIIEDDIEVIDKNVFKYYIDTAKKNNIEHLNFCNTLKPSLCNINGLSFYHNLYAGFQYFTRHSLEVVGLMDERYINLLEHVEHTYRCHLMGLSAPKFHIFPDIENSIKYLFSNGSLFCLFCSLCFCDNIRKLAVRFGVRVALCRYCDFSTKFGENSAFRCVCLAFFCLYVMPFGMS